MRIDRSNPADRLPDRVALVVFDFDGVLTDGRVVVHEDGSESVVCSRADGLGVDLLRQAGIDVMIVSSETGPVVTTRGLKLGVPVFQGVKDKGATLARLLREAGVHPSQMVFVGNDVNDADALRLAGCAVVPSDAHPDVMPLADIILTHPGGRGAARELTDLILSRIQARVERTGARLPSAELVGVSG